MPIISPGGGSGGVASPALVNVANLSSAQCLALGTTPVVLVPAVTGKIIVPVSFCTVLTFGTTAYSQAGSPRVLIGTTFAASGWGASVNFGTLQSAVSSSDFGTAGALEGDAEPLTALTGKPLSYDQTAAVTLGDGTYAIVTFYYLVTP